MPTATHTLVLTKGLYLISTEDADRIRAAMRSSEPMIDVHIDLFGNAEAARPVSLALAHVVALTENPTSAHVQLPGNVAAISERRRTFSSR